MDANRRKLVSRRWIAVLFAVTASLLALVPAATAQEKCPYQLLQVLLPGEYAEPGSEDGKGGEPLVQTVGVPFEVTVRATYEDWETHTGVSHVIKLTCTDDTAELPSAEPMTAGVVVATVVLNAAGSFTFTATDVTDREHFIGVSSVVTVRSSIGSPAALRIADIGPEQIAGVPAAVTIEAVDPDGRRIPDYSGTIQLTRLTGDGEGPVDPESVELAEGIWNGEATFTLAGPARLYAESTDPDPLSGMSNEFDVLPGPYARVQVLAPGQETAPATATGFVGAPVPQITNVPFTVRLRATDRYWNRVADGPRVAVETNDALASAPLLADLVAGAGEIDFTFGTAGTWALTVSDANDEQITPMTSAAISVVSNAPTFVIGPVPATVTAGVPFPVTITVTGPDGSTLTDYSGPAMLACETGPKSIAPADIVFSGGRWQGDVTLFGASPSSAFTCLDYSAPPNIGTSARLEVLPNQFVALQIVLQGEELDGGLDPALTGDARQQTAGVEFPFTVLAVDSWSNHVPDVELAIALTATDPFAALPDTLAMTGGRIDTAATFLRADDAHHLLAGSAEFHSPAIPPTESTAFRVQANEYTKLILLAPGEELLAGSETGKVGDVLDQSVSYGFTLEVLATDNWWNPRDDIADEIQLTSTDDLSGMPPAFTLESGRSAPVARLSTGGFQLITATNLSRSDIPDAVTQIRAINSGIHIEAQVNPAQVIAGQPFTLSISVMNDAGAVMQEINGRVEVKAYNATTGEPGRGKLLNSTFQLLQGRRTMNQTYTGAEPIYLVVDDGLGNQPGISNPIEIRVGPPAMLQFTEAPRWVGGLKSALVGATVADEYGNGIDNIPVGFALTSGRGSLTQLDDVTDLAGLAEARYTGHSEPETGSVQVAGAGMTAELSIETALVDPDAPGGSITNYPNPFHPDEGETTIAYKLDRDADVTLSMYTLSGTLVFETRYGAGDDGGLEGPNEVIWNGTNGEGEPVASGGYILLVEAERDGESIHKMRRRIGVVR